MPNRRTVPLSAALLVEIAAVMEKPQMTLFPSSTARSVPKGNS